MKSATAREVARDLQLLQSPRMDVMFHGLSMEPLLQEGDRVVVEPVAPDAMQLGDVITYRYLDRYPSRRLVLRRGRRLTLWCDNWPQRIFFANTEDVVGRVVARSRGGETLAFDDEAWIELRARAMDRYQSVRRQHLWPRWRHAIGNLVLRR